MSIPLSLSPGGFAKQSLDAEIQLTLINAVLVVAGQSACLVGEDVVHLTELLVEVRSLNSGGHVLLDVVESRVPAEELGLDELAIVFEVALREKKERKRREQKEGKRKRERERRGREGKKREKEKEDC